ncbi:MAG: low molecular weight phosphotyrosine protein phosphatase [Flavobacteriaceae bacterium]|nr:low molecular weight phosphotyrosine protein phosphatase [Flavobacteriaceae bacterium]
MKILFVCLGNICRSPMAETIFRKRIEEIGLSEKVQIDSAGTAGYHEGELADARMRKHSEKRGYSITSRSRKVRMEDFENFDKIIAMDNSNVHNLQQVCPKEYWQKIVKMTDYATRHSFSEVPDPYYGGEAGFELVIDLLEDASEGLLKEIKTEIL